MTWRAISVMPYKVGDTLVIHDFYAKRDGKGKAVEPVKLLSFPGAFVTCHAYRPTPGADAHDLLLGLSNGEVVSTSLRACIAEGGGAAAAGAGPHTPSLFSSTCLFAHSVPVYTYTLAASSSPA